jgi:integrase
MGTNMRFHARADEYLKHARSCLDSALADGRITREDHNLVREFVAEAAATSHIAPQRQYKLTFLLVRWREYLGPYADLTAADLYAGLGALTGATKDDGSSPRYTKNTQIDFTLILKRFALWLVDNGYAKIPEKKIRAIKSQAYTTSKTVGDLFPEEEVLAMIAAAKTPRDRALIALLYEGALRIGEIGNLTWGDVKFGSWNAQINTSEKTGIDRYIPVVMARPYLAAWMDAYPKAITPDAFVFLTSIGHQPLQYAGVLKQLRIIAKNAGITKHLTPHVFRHSRITHLIQKGMSESAIKLMCWGNLTTDQFKTYAHLCNGDIDRATAELNGIVTRETATTSHALDPRQCTRCWTVNAPTARFCHACALPLTEESAAEVSTAITSMESHPEFRAELEALARKYGLA